MQLNESYTTHFVDSVDTDLRIVLPLLEAILKKLGWVISASVQDMLVEAIFAKHLAVIDLHGILGYLVTEVCTRTKSALSISLIYLCWKQGK